jgi:hypothetical protein
MFQRNVCTTSTFRTEETAKLECEDERLKGLAEDYI